MRDEFFEEGLEDEDEDEDEYKMMIATTPVAFGHLDYEPYQRLGLAVCKQAMDDYRDLLLGRIAEGRLPDGDTLKTLENFFHSDAFELLGSGMLDGDTVMRKIRLEVWRKK